MGCTYSMMGAVGCIGTMVCNKIPLPALKMVGPRPEPLPKRADHGSMAGNGETGQLQLLDPFPFPFPYCIPLKSQHNPLRKTDPDPDPIAPAHHAGIPGRLAEIPIL